MERNIMGELDMYRQLGTKPSFTEIGKRYGLDRHTVAKYWNSGGQLEDARRERASGFDQVRDIIEEKAKLPGSKVRPIHEYLLHRRPNLELPGYTTLVHYMHKHDIVCGIPDEGSEPHPRYETPAGKQLQFDWKEDITMHDRHGRRCDFNVFSATLGASRLHRFRYSRLKTTDDTLRCLLSVAVANGGFARKALTDNMSSLVTISNGRRRRSERAWRFAKEAGFEIELAKVRTPQTKGKDESANRFLTRLAVYEGDFEDEADLVAAIAHRGALQRRARRDHGRATRRPVHARREGRAAADRQPPAPRGDGRGRERADGAAHHARARVRPRVVGAEALHWARGQGLRHAVGPDRRHPELAERLLAGTLFEFTCPECGYSASLRSPCLYLDPEHGACVYLVVNEEMAQRAAGMFTELDGEDSAIGHSEKRIVFDRQDLKGVAVALANGLDDRVVEILKTAVAGTARQQGGVAPGGECEVDLVGTEDGDLLFSVVADGNSLTAALPRGAYGLYADALARSSMAGDQPLVVDRAWAERAVDAFSEEGIL
ncbi:CpXC domain-containing protein [Denitrobacterium detoxificans]|nr:CpXC domain-containing protein [Denitrobacterium detoxificans]